MLSARDRMNIIAAYQMVGTYRGAAEMCGVTHKTVRRVIERAQAGEPAAAPPGRARPRNFDEVTDLVFQRVAKSVGRVSAKRLLPVARAAGYQGRRATSAGWSLSRSSCGGGIITGAGGRRCGHGRVPGDRLDPAGRRAAPVLRGAAVVAVAVCRVRCR